MSELNPTQSDWTCACGAPATSFSPNYGPHCDPCWENLMLLREDVKRYEPDLRELADG